MASRVYTAQEMRERANDIDPRKNETESKTLLRVLTDGRKVLGSNLVSDTDCLEQAADMLRQAAEMRERAEELKAQCLKICGRETCDHKGDKCVCCARDVIDFIVRGDEETATDFTVGRMPFVSGDTSRRCE